jgi:hypothetical protein
MRGGDGKAAQHRQRGFQRGGFPMRRAQRQQDQPDRPRQQRGGQTMAAISREQGASGRGNRQRQRDQVEMLRDRQHRRDHRHHREQQRQGQAVNEAGDRRPDRDSLDKIVFARHDRRQMAPPRVKSNDILYHTCNRDVQPCE